MRARFLVLLICGLPCALFAEQGMQKLFEQDLELFEFIAMYEKEDAIFIDAEIEDKNGSEYKMNQHSKKSESDE